MVNTVNIAKLVRIQRRGLVGSGAGRALKDH
jgi:hypothetical protein